MLQELIGMPPNYHTTTMSPGEIGAFLIITGAFVIVIAVAAVIVGIAGRKRVQKLSQMNKRKPLAVIQNPEGEAKPRLSPPEQEPEEPPVRIPSLT